MEVESTWLDDASDNSNGSEGSDTKILRRRRDREIYCGNCGEKGHVYKRCTMPITSFGIVAFRNNESDVINIEKLEKAIGERLDKAGNDITNRMLMVQRKDTMGYVDFLRGRYSSDSEEKEKQISRFIKEMIPSEIEDLKTLTFEELWDKLWVNHSCKCYRNEFENAKNKFNELDIHKVLNGIECTWLYTEFGIPKGRKNMRETNKQCAIREFCEETGYKLEDIELIDTNPVEEVFMGTNGIMYKHVYYIATVKDKSGPPIIDETNNNQIGEIKSVMWLTKSQCLSLVRVYDTEKKKIINNVFDLYEKLKT